ncbi:hypothetical protein CFN16_12375 [Pseudomonas fluorescens]|uniref:Uncharacterized protein n=1 Tax=Pseudomonas fluorescens TaxID=294 RepID=A0A345UWN1_PSEFL|nr:hypothetical protein [Pseudomonas fluorescens]AXJ04883.1 hypothetical protein CFN16_12375 [Pseudomonas fluorescens]
MTQAFTDIANYHQRVKDKDDKRALAVGAALTIIHAKATNTPASSTLIADEMDKLSKYADQIEAALKSK